MPKALTPVPPCCLTAFDIETNQFHNYSAWRNPAPYKGDFPRVFDTVAKYASEYTDELDAVDYLAGHNIAEAVFRKSFEEISAMVDGNPSLDKTGKAVAKDALKLELDNILTTGPYKVSAHHSELYLATMLYLYWDQKDSKGAECVWHQLPADEYAAKVKTAHADTMTTLDEVDEIFEGIYNMAKNRKAPVVMCIHNLSYEVNNCLLNLPIFKKWVRDDAVTFLSNNSKDSYKNITVYATRKGKRTRELIKIVDTWKLTGKSIKQVGKLHKYPKLDYTYNDIKDPSALTPHDYEYNRRDCELSLLAFRDAYIQAADIFDTSGRVPVSANNIVSAISKNLFPKEFAKHKENNTEKGANRMTAEQYKDYKPTTGGGLVGVVPQFALSCFEIGKEYTCKGKKMEVKKIQHIDLNSAHPSQAFKRFFPTCSPVLLDDPAGIATVKKALEEGRTLINKAVTPEGIKKGFDIFSNLVPKLRCNKGKGKDVHTSGYATFKIRGLALKAFDACGIPYNIPTLWGSKVQTTLSGASEYQPEEVVRPKGDNWNKIGSKVSGAEVIEVKLTFEDFLSNVCLFYDFRSYELSDVHLYSMGMISPYLYRQFVHFGNKKKIYKRAVKAIKKNDAAELEEILKDEHFEPVDAEALKREYEAKGMEAAELAENLLKTVKGQFNGIYGTSYQSLFRDSATLSYNMDTDELEFVGTPQYDETNSSGIDVLQGSYIAQWSRVDLALYIRLLTTLKAVPLYFATDSVYYLVTQETADDLEAYIKGTYSYNKQYVEGTAQRLPYNGQVPELEKFRPNGPQLGGMDFEADIQKIGYTQALKIISVEMLPDHETGEIKTARNVTFSGCSADVFFNGCETDDEYFERLFRPDGYVSAFELAKSRRVANDSAEVEGFVLDYVGFQNNATNSEQFLSIAANSFIFL